MSRTVYGLTVQLQALGLQWVDEAHRGRPSHGRLTGQKRVPEAYLRSSRGQRLDVLRGLMDTDGTWNRHRSQAVFTTTSKGLAEDVEELVNSLGWKARIYPQQAHGFGLTVTAYHVTYTPFDAVPFKLRRKADLVRLEGTTQARYRVVSSIEPTASVPTRCIDVDSDDHLYLAGREWLPVHNCLGPSSLDKIRKGYPRHYRVQLFLYGLGYVLMGLPVKRVVIAAYPRTAGSLDGLYIRDEDFTSDGFTLLPEPLALLTEVFEDTARRRKQAEALLAHETTLDQIPAAADDDDCYFCPFYRPEAARKPELLATSCPGARRTTY